MFGLRKYRTFYWHFLLENDVHTCLLRRKRSLEVVGHEEVGRTGTCSVKNMTCSQFPMKANCKVDHQQRISIYLYIYYLSRVLAWAGAGVTRTC